MRYPFSVNDFSVELLAYFDAQKRDLPWRENKDPYRILLSEVMLQQTRIETVKGYFARFLLAFPTIKDLANADEKDVLKLWEGLGYYSRARNLLKGARYIQDECKGVFPSTKEELLKVPGIGEYTASAISSIAFKEKQVSLDGNLFRIYCRLNRKKEAFSSSAAKKEASSFFLDLMPKQRPGDFNEALMDVGETICLPNGAPLCERCPLSAFCAAFKKGDQSEYPLPRSEKEKTRVSISVFIIRWNGLVVIRKRHDAGLLSGLFEFPNLPSKGKGVILPDSVKGKPNYIGHSIHTFSHLIWDMDWYGIECREKPGLNGALFVTEAELREKYALPKAFTNFLRAKKLLGY